MERQRREVSQKRNMGLTFMIVGAIASACLACVPYINKQLYAWNIPFHYGLMIYERANGIIHFLFFGFVALVLGIIRLVHFKTRVTWRSLWIGWKILLSSLGVLTIGALLSMWVLAFLVSGMFHSFDHKSSLPYQGSVYHLSLMDTDKEVIQNGSEIATAIFRIDLYKCDAWGWFCTRIATQEQAFRYSIDLPVFSEVDEIKLILLTIDEPQKVFLFAYSSTSGDKGTLTLPLIP